MLKHFLQAYFNFKINLIAGYGYIDLNNINKSLSFYRFSPRLLVFNHFYQACYAKHIRYNNSV